MYLVDWKKNTYYLTFTRLRHPGEKLSVNKTHVNEDQIKITCTLVWYNSYTVTLDYVHLTRNLNH